MKKKHAEFLKRAFAGILTTALCISSLPSDGFQAVWAGTPAEREDASLVYFVDCGDYVVSTVNAGEQFGTHNSVTDQAYGEDPETGYEWGIVDGEELENKSGDSNFDKNPAAPDKGGVYTANTWAYEYLDTAHKDYPRTETNRYSKNFTEKGIEERFIEYAFELEKGTYEVTVGCANPWNCSNSPDVTAQVSAEEPVMLAKSLAVPHKETAEAVGVVSVDADDSLTVRVSGTGKSNAAVNVAYILIRSIKAGETEDEKKVRKDKEALTLPESVKENLTLPTAGENGSTISWTSSKPEILSAEGEVNRPEGENVTVTLTASISCGEATDTREFTVTVLAVKAPTPAERPDSSILYFVDCGDYVVDTVSKGDQFGTHNSVTDQAYGEDPQTGYTWGIADQETELTGKNVTNGTPKDTGGVNTANTWAYEFLDAKQDYAKTVTNRYTKNFFEKGITERYLDYKFELENGRYDVTVCCVDPWNCSKTPNVYANYGKDSQITIKEKLNASANEAARKTVEVTDGELTINLRATGDDNKAINLAYILITTEMPPEKKVQADYEALTIDTQVTSDLQLITEGVNGSTITWNSSDEAVISKTGKVNRPAVGEADAEVTLTAEISCGEVSMTKIFKVTVTAVSDLEDLQEFSLGDIELTDDYYINVTKKDVAFLNDFDPDRLLYNFRLTAGYTANEIKDGRFDFNQDGKYASSSYSGWENSRIAGHTLGHYLAAAAQGVAAGYGNEKGSDGRSLAERLEYLIDELKNCQDKLKTGFIFGATMADANDPERQFNLLERGDTRDTWVPWYTMHKIVNGLVETYKYTKNETALTVAEALGEWIYNRTSKWNSSIQAKVLGVEYGGMNDCLYELYKCAKAADYANAAHFSAAAHWFDEDNLFELVLAGTPNALNGRHANCTIPKFIGALNRYRVLKDEQNVDKYLQYAESFWALVVNDHTYITGGNSECEFFGADNILDAERSHCNNETCNTHNMLKLARELYRITGDKKYADYYETTFINAIMASVNEVTGMTTYFQPMATGFFKVYCDPNLDTNYFWCCTGTGLENFTKLGDSFYFYSGDKLIVNEYTSSSVSWKEKGIVLQQVSDIPNSDKTVFTIRTADFTEGAGASDSVKLDLRFRVPDWIAGSPVVTLNGTVVEAASSGGYLSLNRSFQDGDTIELTLPMGIKAYTLPDNAGNVYGFKYGPVVLAAELGTDNKMDTYQIGVQCEVCKTKIVNGLERTSTNGYGSTSNQGTLSSETLNILEDVSIEKFMADIEQYLVKSEDSLTFTLKGTDWGGEHELVFTPYYRIHDQRYGIYWLFARGSAEEIREQLLKNKAAGRDANVYLEGIGIGYGAQTEGNAENYPHIEETGTGSVGKMENLTRYANAGGSFSYLFKVDKTKTNYITCKYSPEDNGKTIVIKVGDIVIAEDTLNYDGDEELYQKKYEIPAAAVEAAKEYAYTDTDGKEKTKDVIRISFSGPDNAQSPALHDSAFTSTNYSTNAGIAALSSNVGSVTKTDESSYRLETAKNIQKIQLKTDIADTWGLLYINEELTDDTKAKEILLDSDETTVAIRVYAEDHETARDYRLTISRSLTDQQVADAVKNLINAIGTVSNTTESKNKIDAARKAYQVLSEEQKSLIEASVYKILTDAEERYQELVQDEKAADGVKNLIDAIGTVSNTTESKAKIDAARKAYDALSTAQKQLIAADVLKKLTDAESSYQEFVDEAAADTVKELIDAIGTVSDTTESKEKIDAARKAYDELSAAQKKLIPADILKKLTDAEARYKELTNGAGTADADQKAADAVKNLINAIGTVSNTAESKSKIDAARKAYDALSAAQKQLIAADVLKKLTDAEARYKELTGGAGTPGADKPDNVKSYVGKTVTVKNYRYKITGQNNSKKTGTASFAGVTGTKKKAKTITVPAGIKYKGITFTVTAVNANAFKGNKRVSKVIIGKNVKTIGKNAFYNCKKLKNISFKGTKVTSIGKGAFLKIASRPNVTVPKSVKKKYKKLLTKKVITTRAKIK